MVDIRYQMDDNESNNRIVDSKDQNTSGAMNCNDRVTDKWCATIENIPDFDNVIIWKQCTFIKTKITRINGVISEVLTYLFGLLLFRSNLSSDILIIYI